MNAHHDSFASDESASHARWFQRSPARSAVLAFLCFPLGIGAMIIGLFAWTSCHYPLNTYAAMGNLVIGTMKGILVGFACALVFPTALKHVRGSAIALGFVAAIIVATIFVALTGGYPLGPMGLALVSATLVLHIQASRKRPDPQHLCPRCAYDMRGIEAYQCPECGIEKFAALELHDLQRFKANLVIVCLIAEAALWVILTFWLWDARVLLD